MMHVQMHFYGLVDEGRWCLADLLQARSIQWARLASPRALPGRPDRPARQLGAPPSQRSLPVPHACPFVQEPGQSLTWRYDIGDGWVHSITVVEVAGEGESTGRAAVLDGAGACPPEDSVGLEGMGNGAYQASSSLSGGLCSALLDRGEA